MDIRLGTVADIRADLMRRFGTCTPGRMHVHKWTHETAGMYDDQPTTPPPPAPPQPPAPTMPTRHDDDIYARPGATRPAIAHRDAACKALGIDPCCFAVNKHGTYYRTESAVVNRVKVWRWMTTTPVFVGGFPLSLAEAAAATGTSHATITTAFARTEGT